MLDRTGTERDLELNEKDISRNIRDFLWKSTHNALKVGDFWSRIPGSEDRATCQICGETDTMEHILTKCAAPGREIIWKLAEKLWHNKYEEEITPGFGGILGCGLSNFEREGARMTGKNRLYRIVVSESAFMIWKIRCERQIGGRNHSDIEIHNKWVGIMNQRLALDCTLSNRTRYGRKAMVKNTWSGCVANIDSLPEQ